MLYFSVMFLAAAAATAAEIQQNILRKQILGHNNSICSFRIPSIQNYTSLNKSPQSNIKKEEQQKTLHWNICMIVCLWLCPSHAMDECFFTTILGLFGQTALDYGLLSQKRRDTSRSEKKTQKNTNTDRIRVNFNVYNFKTYKRRTFNWLTVLWEIQFEKRVFSWLPLSRGCQVILLCASVSVCVCDRPCHPFMKLVAVFLSLKGFYSFLYRSQLELLIFLYNCSFFHSLFIANQ